MIVEISYEVRSNTETDNLGFIKTYKKHIYLEMPETVASEARRGIYDTRIFTILQAAADLQDCTLSGIDKVTY